MRREFQFIVRVTGKRFPSGIECSPLIPQSALSVAPSHSPILAAAAFQHTPIQPGVDTHISPLLLD
jgi:hypothetical protein